MTLILPTPLSGILLLLGAWLLIGLAGLLRPGSLALAARTLFPLGAICGLALAVLAASALLAPPQRMVLPAGLPDLPLHALDGRTVAARSLLGQWLLVVVGPASCDTACDERLFMQRQLREMLGKDRDRVDKVWFVTDDAPLAPSLQAAVEAQPALTVLRVDRQALARWLAPAPGQVLEDHLYLVDPMGEWMMRLPPRPEPARVKRDLERLMRASAGWDQPGR